MSRLAVATLLLAGVARGQSLTYARDVKPILDEHCAGCHNHALIDKKNVGAGLALDSFDGLTRNAAAVKAGNSAQSELIKRLESADPAKRMPLGGAPLPRATIETIRKWIDGGAAAGQIAPLPPADASVGPAVTVKLRDVFLPYGRRNPVAGSTPQQQAKARPALDVPGALVIEEEASAERIVTAPYQNGIRATVGPLAPVTAVTFHPDGKRLLTGSLGRAVVWDLARMEVVGEIAGLDGSVNGLEFSPDGSMLSIVGGRAFSPGQIRLFEAASFKPIAQLQAHREVILDQAFSPDSARLATVGFDRAVEVWDIKARKRLLQLTDHSDTVQCIAFDASGKRLASGSMDRTAKLSDAGTGAGIITINPETKGILAVAFSPDMKYILTAGESPEVRWWEISDIGESVTERGWTPARKMAGHVAPIYDMRFSPDGSVLATASADRTVRLWDGKSGQMIRTLVDADDLLYSVAFSPDSRLVAAAGGDGITRLWEVRSGKLMALFAHRSLKRSSPVEWLSVNPDGSWLSSVGIRNEIKLVRGAHAASR